MSGLILPDYYADEDAPAVPEPVLDLTWSAWEQDVGRSIRFIGTWRIDNRDPCMVIIPSDRHPGRTMPCVVTQACAWRWDEESGRESAAWAAFQAAEFAAVLPSLNPHSQADLIWLLDKIRSRLDDLVMMRPAPPREQRTVGHVNIRNAAGEITDQQDVKRDV